jgi:S-adenosylmethionine synthetase
VPIGGGALSGKDLYKADRAGAVIARRLAKGVVMTGAARECTVTVAFFPGEREASLVSLANEHGARLNPERWARLFDLSLAGVGDRYTLQTPLVDVARHGHFTDPTRPWERLALDSTRSGEAAIANRDG